MTLNILARTMRVAVLFAVAWGACDTALADINNSGSVSPTISEIGNFSTGDVQVGISGPGSLQVSGASILSSTSGRLGTQLSGSGTASVTDQAEWNVSGNLELGSDASASGTLSVIDAMVSAQEIVIGVEGLGTINLDDAAQLNTDSVVLGQMGAAGIELGTASLTDGSQWINSGAFVVGSGAQASMVVASGSAIETATLEVGRTTTATLDIQGGGATPISSTVSTSGLATLGTNAGSHGSVTVGGQGANWTSTGIIEIGRDGEGTLGINAEGTVTSAGGAIARNATSPPSSVTIAGAGAAWTVNGDLHVGGSANGAGGEGTLELLPDGQANVTGTLHNWPNGTLTVNGGIVSATSVQHDGESGNFLINGGTLNANSILAPFGFTMFDGNISAGSITAANTFIAGGTLHVNTFNGDLDNNGATLSPGMSAGTATIDGNFTQNAPGTLLIELNSVSTFDRLSIAGTLAPHGSTLEIQLVGGYSPAAGQSFDILDWGTIDLFGGEFTLQLPTLGNGLKWNTSQLHTTGVLSVIAGVCCQMLPGDYNSDNIVDTADYLIWRKNVGTNSALPNDPIGGLIGQQHYDQWRSNFGQSLGTASGPGFQDASSLVPEPASATLLLGCALLLGSRRRRNL